MATIRITLEITVDMDADDVNLSWAFVHDSFREGAFEVAEHTGSLMALYELKSIKVED